jgi:hypothetical protein
LVSREPNPHAVDRDAKDVSGRIQFGIASALLRISAIAGTILAATMLARRVGSGAATAFLTILAATCIAFGITALTVDRPDTHIGKIKPIIETIFQVTHPDHLENPFKRAIFWNIMTSLMGGFAVLVAFALVALRAPSNDSDIAGLRSRMRDLQRRYTVLFSWFS